MRSTWHLVNKTQNGGKPSATGRQIAIFRHAQINVGSARLRINYPNMAASTAIGIPQILSIVTICITLLCFILQLEQARSEEAECAENVANGIQPNALCPHPLFGIHNRDHVLVAALG